MSIFLAVRFFSLILLAVAKESKDVTIKNQTFLEKADVFGQVVDRVSQFQNLIADSESYVFLQKFPLRGSEFAFHTEVIVCPQDDFDNQSKYFLEEKISNLLDFVEIDSSIWAKWTVSCVQLGYGRYG